MARRHSVHDAITEILEAAHLKQIHLHQRTFVKVQIKIADCLSESDAHLVWFNVKVCLNSNLDIKTLIGNGHLQSLAALILHMQAVEDGSHLCLQKTDPDDDTKLLQEHYEVDDLTHSQAEEPPIHSQVKEKTHDQFSLREVDVSKKTKQSSSTLAVYFRIYDAVSEMMKDGQKIYSYIQQLKIFNPQVDASFLLKVHGTITETDFSDTSYVTCESIHVVDSARFYWRSKYVNRHMKVLPVSEQPTVLTEPCGNKVTVSVTAMLIGINGRTNIKLSKTAKGILSIAFFGPGNIPLSVDSDNCSSNFLCLIPWYKYQIQTKEVHKSSYDLQGLVLGDCLYSLEPLNGGLGQADDEVSYVVVLCVLLGSPEVADSPISPDAVQKMKKLYPRLLATEGAHVSLTVQSALDKLLNCTKSSDIISENQKTLSKGITGIVGAINDIVLHSSNENFRHRCFCTLQVTSLKHMEKALIEKFEIITRKKYGYCPSKEQDNQLMKRNCSSSQIIGTISPDDRSDEAAEPSQDFDNLRLHREFAFQNETVLQNSEISLRSDVELHDTSSPQIDTFHASFYELGERSEDVDLFESHLDSRASPTKDVALLESHINAGGTPSFYYTQSDDDHSLHTDSSIAVDAHPHTELTMTPEFEDVQLPIAERHNESKGIDATGVLDENWFSTVMLDVAEWIEE